MNYESWNETARMITDPAQPAPEIPNGDGFSKSLDAAIRTARQAAMLKAATSVLELAEETRSIQSSERFWLRKAAERITLLADKEVEGLT